MPWEISPAKLGHKRRVYSPVAAFLVQGCFTAYKAVMQGKVMTDCVFPASPVLGEFGVAVCNEVIDLAQGESLTWWAENGTGNHCYIRQRRWISLSVLLCTFQCVRFFPGIEDRRWFSCFFHLCDGVYLNVLHSIAKRELTSQLNSLGCLWSGIHFRALLYMIKCTLPLSRKLPFNPLRNA